MADGAPSVGVVIPPRVDGDDLAAPEPPQKGERGLESGADGKEHPITADDAPAGSAPQAGVTDALAQARDLFTSQNGDRVQIADGSFAGVDAKTLCLSSASAASAASTSSTFSTASGASCVSLLAAKRRLSTSSNDAYAMFPQRAGLWQGGGRRSGGGGIGGGGRPSLVSIASGASGGSGAQGSGSIFATRMTRSSRTSSGRHTIDGSMLGSDVREPVNFFFCRTLFSD